MAKKQDRAAANDSVPSQPEVSAFAEFLSEGPVRSIPPVIIGSRGGNVALASLLSGLCQLGLILDYTTA